VNRQNLLTLGAAVFLGLIAVFLVNAYFSGRDQQQAQAVSGTRLVSVAVAAQPIDFGGHLTNTNVRLANFPADAVPAGAFTNIADALKNRVALRPLVPGEPILASRVSGTDGRATIAANLPDGQLAVAIPISDVAGVGGFIRPGDAVDVLLTRQIPNAQGTTNAKMTDVLMQAVPVLAVDQVADSNKTDPALGKTATLQVDTYGAQRLALAREMGTLSLALRNVASKQLTGTRTVLPRDLTQAAALISAPVHRIAAAPRRHSPPPRHLALSEQPERASMTVFRKGLPTNYEVRHGY
jgi:pilus assembly protein CpaB